MVTVQVPQCGQCGKSAAVIKLAAASKKMGLDVWCYTGWTIEDILSGKAGVNKDVLRYIDVLVDGPFIEELKDESLEYRGSSNQRVINCCSQQP